MKQEISITLLAACLFFSSINKATGGSLWAKKDTNMPSSYSDDVAHKIGDILTITINEISDMENKSDRKMSKKTSRDQQFDGNLSIEHIVSSVPSVTFGAGTEYSNEFDSKADNKNERSFIDNITVVVIDIMPNGNLVVNGTRKRNISDDIQEIEVSGIVRPSDITYGNIIDSKRIANFNIITKYKGAAAPFNKPGWLGRILDMLWPF